MTGRVHFPARYLSEAFAMDDGQVFTVFRHIKLACAGRLSQSASALLVVRFHFARFTHAVNRVLSLLPIPLIAGSPGFREKVWMVNEHTGEWLGLYEWDSERTAEAYKRSFVLRVMMRRAATESVSFHTVPDTSLSDYLQQLRGQGG
jgi:hypothetical protein